MNIDSVLLKIKRSYKKNLPVLHAYRKRLYPGFVFERRPTTVSDEVPVFTFHFLEPAEFEEQLQFLAANNYQTLTADEFHQMIIGTRSMPERAVLITFDDGWGSLWTYGYPLLKKYGMHGVSFINPGLINNNEAHFHNLIDLWEGRISDGQLIDRERGEEPLCTWGEIKKMAKSGAVEFQSHTMYHSLIMTSPEIVDFFHPSIDTYINNYNIPIFQNHEKDDVKRKVEWGMPMYVSAPRMAEKKRCFDDEKLRAHCISFVRENGGTDFFKKRAWRAQLRQLVTDYRNRAGENGNYESEEEQRGAIYWDLLESKRMIEEKLPGASVRHFCYPYFTGSQLAVELSKEAGYLCNYWGVLENRRGNRPGDDPYRTVRVPDEFIFRLPGHGRKSLWQIIEQGIVKDSLRFFRNLVKPDHRSLC